MKDDLQDRITDSQAPIGDRSRVCRASAYREFFEGGFKVVGLDPDESKVRQIRRGESHVKHIDYSFLKDFVLGRMSKKPLVILSMILNFLWSMQLFILFIGDTRNLMRNFHLIGQRSRKLDFMRGRRQCWKTR